MRFPRIAAACLAAAALAVVTTGVAAASTDSGKVHTDIVGGRPAVRTLSFMGAMEDRSNTVHCGATLIAPNIAVTAGHCVFNPDGTKVSPSLIKMRFGSTDRTTGGQITGVSRTVAHPRFTPPEGPGPDIAVLVLTKRVPLAPAPIARTAPRPGTTVRLLGWGQTCPQPDCERNQTRLLQQIDTTVLSPSGCRAGFNPAFELCFQGTTTHTACFGDSGGPALVQTAAGFALVGATSRGGGDNPVCGTGNDIYTNVTAFRRFIAGATGTRTG